MLNHAIDNLTTTQEDVFLTTGLVGFTRNDYHGRVCFLGALDLLVVARQIGHQHYRSKRSQHYDDMLAQRFNALCVQLGGARVRQRDGTWALGSDPNGKGAARLGNLIRNRILSNRARRILQNAPVSRDTEVTDGQSVGACRFGRGE